MSGAMCADALVRSTTYLHAYMFMYMDFDFLNDNFAGVHVGT